MIKIGLTGGIGAGKSTVSDLFAARGIPVIDTDILAREVIVRPDVLDQLTETFGEQVIDAEGTLDRAGLASIVFDDDSQRQKLESLLHPLIRQEVSVRADALQEHPYIIVVVPLLLETDFHTLVDRILVVDAAPSQQLERVSDRDARPPGEIEKIMFNQIARESRLSRADDIIDNSGTPDGLAAQVDQLDAHYRTTG